MTGWGQTAPASTLLFNTRSHSSSTHRHTHTCHRHSVGIYREFDKQEEAFRFADGVDGGADTGIACACTHLCQCAEARRPEVRFFVREDETRRGARRYIAADEQGASAIRLFSALMTRGKSLSAQLPAAAAWRAAPLRAHAHGSAMPALL
jgi:hypothetical protein